MIEKLQELGLSKNECKIYFELAVQKSATASHLAKSTGINRTVAYNLLQSLQNKGLVYFIKKDGQRDYCLSPYHNFIEKIKEKERLAKEVISELQKINPLQNTDKNIEIYNSLESFKAFHREMLKAKEILVLNATGLIWGTLKHSHGLIKEIGKRNIRIIANKKFKLEEEYPNVKIKYLPTEKINYATTFIFKNKVIIQTLKDRPLAVKIEAKEIYDGYKSNFGLLWEKLG